MIFSGSQNCFYCYCLFVTDNPEPCVDRYMGIRKYGAQRLSDQLEMNELSTKCPNSKVHHSADICCILTMCQALTCMRDTMVNDMGGKPVQGCTNCGLGPVYVRTICGTYTHVDSRVQLTASEFLGLRLEKLPG